MVVLIWEMGVERGIWGGDSNLGVERGSGGWWRGGSGGIWGFGWWGL